MEQKGLIRDRGFYNSIFKLALPLALQSAFMYSVTTLDSIMLGTLGEIPMSASAIANQPFQVASGIFRGLVLGGSVLIAQYWGKGDKKAIRRVIALCVRWSLLIGLICSAVAFAFPREIMGIFSTDTAVIEAGVGYLRIISLTYGMYAVSNAYMLSVRAMEDARTPFLTNVVSYSLNIFFNYAFIFGKFGLPQMGIIGVAIGTLIARMVELAICIVHMLFINKRVRVKIKDFFRRDKILFRDFMKYALPSMLSEMIFTIGMACYAVVFGRLGTTTIAANTIADVAYRISSLVIAGLAGSSAVIIGKTIGSGDIARAKREKTTFNFLTFVLGVVAMIIAIAIKNPILSLYNVTAETAQLADWMILTVGLFMVPYAYECVYVTGLQVGSGDTTNILIYTTIIMWAITMPLAFLGAFYFKWHPIIIFIILKADYALKGIYGFFRLRGDKWIKKATRDEKDLHTDDDENVPVTGH